MSEFSDFLFRRRKKLNLTQQNIADKLNVSNKAVSKWETGECYPESIHLVPLAKLLECTVDELLQGIENEEKKADAPEPDIIEKEVSPTSKKQPCQKLLIAGAIVAAFGIIVMFLFKIANADEPYQNTIDAWATGILIFFLFVSAGLFLAAVIAYINRSK